VWLRGAAVELLELDEQLPQLLRRYPDAGILHVDAEE
jgi:hypothetical protein